MERPDRTVALASRIAAVAALGSCAIGILVLVGWAFDVEPLRRLMLGKIHMLPNSAVGFVLGGASRAARGTHPRRPRPRPWRADARRAAVRLGFRHRPAALSRAASVAPL